MIAEKQAKKLSQRRGCFLPNLSSNLIQHPG